MKEDYQRALKKLTLFFLLNPVPFNRQNYQNRGLELVTSHYSGYKTSPEKFLYYVLSDQVWWCNIKQFLNYSKNYICKFTQANLWHHTLFHFHLPFSIWRVWKGRKKILKIWISLEQKEPFRWNKKHFS